LIYESTFNSQVVRRKPPPAPLGGFLSEEPALCSNKTPHPASNPHNTREIEHAYDENGKASAVPSLHLRRSRERFSTPHAAVDPNKINEINSELENEDLQEIIRHPLNVGAVRLHHEPESIDTSHASVNSHHIPGHYRSHHCWRTISVGRCQMAPVYQGLWQCSILQG